MVFVLLSCCKSESLLSTFVPRAGMACNLCGLFLCYKSRVFMELSYSLCVYVYVVPCVCVDDCIIVVS